jgi:hypothetical protein
MERKERKKKKKKPEWNMRTQDREFPPNITQRVLYKFQPFSALKIAQPASEDARRRLEGSHHL